MSSIFTKSFLILLKAVKAARGGKYVHREFAGTSVDKKGKIKNKWHYFYNQGTLQKELAEWKAKFEAKQAKQKRNLFATPADIKGVEQTKPIRNEKLADRKKRIAKVLANPVALESAKQETLKLIQQHREIKEQPKQTSVATPQPTSSQPEPVQLPNDVKKLENLKNEFRLLKQYSNAGYRQSANKTKTFLDVITKIPYGNYISVAPKLHSVLNLLGIKYEQKDEGTLTKHFKVSENNPLLNKTMGEIESLINSKLESMSSTEPVQPMIATPMSLSSFDEHITSQNLTPKQLEVSKQVYNTVKDLPESELRVRLDRLSKLPHSNGIAGITAINFVLGLTRSEAMLGNDNAAGRHNVESRTIPELNEVLASTSNKDYMANVIKQIETNRILPMTIDNLKAAIAALPVKDSSIIEKLVRSMITQNQVNYNKAVTPNPISDKFREEQLKKNNEALSNKFNALADAMEKTIDSKINSAIGQQRTTARRARIAGGMASEGYKLQEIQSVLRGMALAIRNNDLPKELQNIKSRSDLETVYNYSGYQKQRPESDYVTPYLHDTTAKEILKSTRGLTATEKRLLEKYSVGDGSYFRSESDIETYKGILTKARKQKTLWYLNKGDEKLRLHSLGIKTKEQLIGMYDVLRSLRHGYTAPDPKLKKIKDLETKLIGQKIPDFFPTPKRIIEDMISRADIQSGMKVLEPSAGKGDIADALLEKGIPVDTIEPVFSLSEILKEKGHNVLDTQDFLDLNEKYDRIVMNPPFGKGADMKHVRHAYALLKPGGKLVSIMGEGGFFRSDNQSKGFREWLDSVNSDVEKLPEGSFRGVDSFVQTGANTRMVTITKPVENNFETMQDLPNQHDYKTNGVKAKAFKSWFGDWEQAKQTGNYSNVSKVIDKFTGKPKETYDISKVVDKGSKPIQVYHGTAVGGFTEFSKDKMASWNLYGEGFYFTEDKDIAKEYTEKDSDIKDLAASADTYILDGKEITHFPKEGINKILSGESFDNGRYRSQIKNPNWEKQFREAFDASMEPNGFNIKKFKEAYYNSKQWNQYVDFDHKKHGLKALFETDFLREFPGIQPVAPKSELFSVFLNIKKPLDMDKSLSVEETNNFMKSLDSDLYMDDILSYKYWDSLGFDYSIHSSQLDFSKLFKIKEIMANIKFEKDHPETQFNAAHKKGDPVFPVMQRGDEYGLTYEQIYYIITNSHKDSKNITRKIKDMGYDGMSHNGGWRTGNRDHKVWIAFEPNQIKAVENSGDFNPKENNMYKAFLLRKSNILTLLKGKKAQEGEVRTWGNGKQFKKVGGKWQPVAGDKKKAAPKEKKERKKKVGGKWQPVAGDKKKAAPKEKKERKKKGSAESNTGFSMKPFAEIKRIAQYTKEADFDKEKIEQYKNSIAEHGYDPAFPMVIDKDKKTGAYNVVAGNHRYKAVESLIAEGKLPKDFEIPTVMREFEDENARLAYQVRENQRRDPLPTDEANAYKKMADNGWDAARIAKELGQPVGKITKRLALSNLSPDLFNLVSKKGIPVGIAEAIGLGSVEEESGKPNHTIQLKAYQFYRDNKGKGYGAGEVLSFIRELKSNASQKFFENDGKSDTEKEALRSVGSEEKAKRNVKMLDNTFKTMQKALSQLMGDSVGQINPKLAKELSASIVAAQGESEFSNKMKMLDTVIQDMTLMKEAFLKSFKGMKEDSSMGMMFASSINTMIHSVNKHTKAIETAKAINKMLSLAYKTKWKLHDQSVKARLAA